MSFYQRLRFDPGTTSSRFGSQSRTCPPGTGLKLNIGKGRRVFYTRVKRTWPLIYIHWRFSSVSSFRFLQMLVWRNQHLDSVLMCHRDDPVKITTFDMTPCYSHCPQLSPTSRGKTIQSICPLERSKAWPHPFQSIIIDSTFAKSLHKWDCASGIFFSGVFLKGGETSRDIKEFRWGVWGVAWKEVASHKKSSD